MNNLRIIATITLLLMELSAVSFLCGVTTAGILKYDVLEESTDIPETITTAGILNFDVLEETTDIPETITAKSNLQKTEVDTLQNTVSNHTINLNRNKINLTKDDLEKKSSNITSHEGITDMQKDISNYNSKNILRKGTRQFQNKTMKILSKVSINMQNTSQNNISKFKSNFEKNISIITSQDGLSNLQKHISNNNSKDILPEGATDLHYTTKDIASKDKKNSQINIYNRSQETVNESNNKSIKPQEMINQTKNNIENIHKFDSNMDEYEYHLSNENTYRILNKEK